MKRKNSIQPLVRRGIYVVLFVLAAVLQGTFLGAARFAPVLLVPLTAAVCAHEREFSGLFFGLLGGVLYDALSPAADGVFTLLFAAAGCAVGLLMHYVFRGTLLSVFILTLAFSLLTVITGSSMTPEAPWACSAAATCPARLLPRCCFPCFTIRCVRWIPD